MGTMRSFLWAMVACACLATAVQADTLYLKDGRRLEGKLLGRGTDGKVTFQVVLAGTTTVMAFEAAEVESLKEGPLPVTSKPAASAPTSRPLVELPPPPDAPPVVKATGPTYYLIPVHGRVGRLVMADVLEKSLADAAKRSPSAVILEVDSPGGYIAEVPKITDVIRKYSKKLRIVVYVQKHAISAAAILSLAANDLYMSPGAIIGAATAYRLDEEDLPAEISEKFQSVWRATARSSAEQGGHSLLLAEGMIDNKLELYVVEELGKKVVKEGKGGNIVKRMGRLLTMTAGEALACGLSGGTAETYEDLGKLLKFSGWTECKGLAVPLAAHWEQTVKAVETKYKALHEGFEDNMRQAAETDPSQFTYTIYRSNQQFTAESKQKWQERSAACGRFLARAEVNIKDAGTLADQFPQLLGDTEILKEQLRKSEKAIEIIRKRIIEKTYKKGVAAD